SGVISDWSEVNQQLRHHGFHPIMILPRTRFDQIPKGGVILEEHTTQHLRHTLENLMSDCDRRQALVQELISASNRMQKENKEYAETMNSYETEIRELENQLQAEQVNVQEMEERRLSELYRHGEEVQDLKMTKGDVMALFKQMEQKILKKDDEIARLQKRCQDLVHKEEERLGRQSKMFRHFKSRSPRKQNAVDQKVLEVIDSYEAKLDELQEELGHLKYVHCMTTLWTVPHFSLSLQCPQKERDDHNASYIGSYGDVESDPKPMSQDESEVYSNETTDEGRGSLGRRSPVAGGSKTGTGGRWRQDKPKSPAQSPRLVKNVEQKLMHYEKHVKDAKKLIRLLENENTHLKMELQTRPMPDEWKKTRKYNKKLERILAKNNLCPPSRKRHIDKDNSEQVEQVVTKRYSTHVDDIDFMPIDVCRDHLKEVCSRLLVLDLRDLYDRLKSIDLMSEAFPSMEQLVTDTLALIHDKGTPKVPSDHLHQSVDTHAVFCQRAWQHILPTLRLWAKELRSLKDLQKAVIDLSIALMPWKPESMFEPKDNKTLRVKDLKAMVESLSQQDRRAGPHDIKGTEKPTVEQLQSIVAHFQKLFDVTTVSGVFPRMNELYLRVGEVYNAMHAMRELLNLDSSCRAADVVNAVGKLSKARHLLKVDDLSGYAYYIRELKVIPLK
ncbi:hypothetical protein QZH41_009693, partial [Actinostola sp. cb2023]